MPEDNCKLCLQSKSLQLSHLMPAAVYNYARDPSRKNPNPWLLSRGAKATTSRQVVDRLLCTECEGLFNKKGEQEALKWICNGKRFPLGERLAEAIPMHVFGGFRVFSGAALGVDARKLAYFAISVVWRAAVHRWDTPFGGKTTLLSLGKLQEPVRRYLLGEVDLPPELSVLATACSDPYSRRVFHMPLPVLGVSGAPFDLLALGVHFRVFTEGDVPPSLRTLCCVRSPEHLILQRDCGRAVIEAFSQVSAAGAEIEE